MALSKIKGITSLNEMAAALGYSAAGLAYVLYKMPESNKYLSFDIPKKSGGLRTISAPAEQLKLLQSRLSVLLYECCDEIALIDKRRGSASHGFVKGRSAATNAKPHVRKRFVLNIDISDFFGQINFGRVWGYFMKDKYFSMSPKGATLLAQIATHQNMLPQGSPCSPIIANLVAGALDSKLITFARQNKLQYTRYADDITFSTNLKLFPEKAGLLQNDGTFALSEELAGVFSGSGFPVNAAKIRFQSSRGNQSCTGLVVNRRVNVSKVYYRNTRAMCETVYKTGTFFVNKSYYENSPSIVTEDRLSSIEGRLAYIYSIRSRFPHDPLLKNMPFSGIRRQYARFLFWRNFLANERPVLICEGDTDFVYLKKAIQYIKPPFKALGLQTPTGFSHALHFFTYTNAVVRILALSGGTDPIKNFIIHYHEDFSSYPKPKSEFPVIILIDNDDGANPIFSICKQKKLTITHKTTDEFYRIDDNLYLIKTPESPSPSGWSCIEDSFDASTRAIKLGGKKLNLGKNIDTSKEYGKRFFAEKVVMPQAKKIDFSGFLVLLKRIEAVIADYASLKAAGKV